MKTSKQKRKFNAEVSPTIYSDDLTVHPKKKAIKADLQQPSVFVPPSGSERGNYMDQLPDFDPRSLSATGVDAYLMERQTGNFEVFTKVVDNNRRVQSAVADLAQTVEQISQQVKSESDETKQAIAAMTEVAMQELNPETALDGFTWKLPLSMLLRDFLYPAIKMVDFYEGNYGNSLNKCQWAYLPIPEPLGLLFSKKILLAYCRLVPEMSTFVSTLHQTLVHEQPSQEIIDKFQQWFAVSSCSISHHTEQNQNQNQNEIKNQRADEQETMQITHVTPRKQDGKKSSPKPPDQIRNSGESKTKTKVSVSDRLQEDLFFIPHHQWDFLVEIVGKHRRLVCPLLKSDDNEFDISQSSFTGFTGVDIVKKYPSWSNASWKPRVLWGVPVPSLTVTQDKSQSPDIRNQLLTEILRTGKLGEHWLSGDDQKEETLYSWVQVVALSLQLHPDVLSIPSAWTKLRNPKNLKRYQAWWLKFKNKYPVTVNCPRGLSSGV